LNIFGFTAQQTVTELCEHLITGDTAGALGAIHAQAEAGKDLSRLLSDLIEHLRNLLVIQCDPDGATGELSAESIAAITEQSTRIPADKLLDLIEQFAAAEQRMKWAANKKMHFEIAAIRAIQSLNQASLTEVLDALTALRGGGPPPGGGGSRLPVARPAPSSTPAPVRKAAAPASAAEPNSASASASTPVSAPATATAPASRPSLSATVGAALGEKKAPAPTPTTKVEPAPKVLEEPAPKPVPTAAPVLATVSAKEIWPQFVIRVRKERPILRMWVESGQLVDIANGVAVLGFPQEAALAKDNCEGANYRVALERILSEIVGQPIALKCEIRPGLVVESVPSSEIKPEAAKDPMETFKNDPLIQKALAEFKAEIIPA